jgi:hypothetical protein
VGGALRGVLRDGYSGVATVGGALRDGYSGLTTVGGALRGALRDGCRRVGYGGEL